MYVFLTSAVERRKLSTSLPPQLYPQDRKP